MTDVDTVARMIATTRFHAADEAALQAGIAQVLGVLDLAGVPVQREVRLTRRERIDFLVGRLGIEVKVRGSVHDVRRQLVRYAATGALDEILLISTHVLHGQFHGTEVGDLRVWVARPRWL